MDEQQKTSVLSVWNHTVKEISSNWKTFSRVARREWEEQLNDDNSPLQKAIHKIKEPANLPEPVKDQVIQTVETLKAITDSGLDTFRDFLHKLR